MEERTIETLFIFEWLSLFYNVIFSSDILLCVAYGDVCKKANISFVGKCFIVRIIFDIRREYVNNFVFEAIKAIESIHPLPEYTLRSDSPINIFGYPRWRYKPQLNIIFWKENTKFYIFRYTRQYHYIIFNETRNLLHTMNM